MKRKIIEAKNVKKSFNTGGINNLVIKDLNLDIFEGDFTVIMGASGSGKSTILYLLSGMDKTTEGDIVFENKNLKKEKGKKIAEFRRNKIGFVFQGINLIPYLSVLENVIVAGYLRNETKKNILDESKKLLKRVGLGEAFYKKPSQISGGQAQRAAIVRALINKPSVVFADEPTGALNSTNGKEILDIMTEINMDGQNIVMVTHDAKAALRGNRIIYIKDGEITGDLELEKYEESKEREAKLHTFLSERGW